MTWTIIITLVLAGLIFLILEILVFPGTSVVGIIGFVMLIGAIWGAYTYQGALYGHFTLGGSFVLTFVAFYFSLRSKTWKKLALDTEIEGKVNTLDEDIIKVGDVGKTTSRLAPMGNVMFHNDIYEVATNGDFIDQGREVTIIKIEKNKIL